MIRSEAVALIKKRLKRPNDSALDAQIVTEMQFVQEQVLEESGDIRPWFLLSENLTTPTEVGESRVQVPNNFLDEYEEGSLWILDPTDSEYKALGKGTFEDVRLEATIDEDDDPGMPQIYSLDGKYFRIKPVPDKVYTLQILVYLRDAVLASDSSTNMWLTYAAELLISETGLVVAQGYLQDAAATTFFTSRRDAAMARLHRQNEARKHSNMDYRMTYGARTNR